MPPGVREARVTSRAGSCFRSGALEDCNASSRGKDVFYPRGVSKFILEADNAPSRPRWSASYVISRWRADLEFARGNCESRDLARGVKGTFPRECAKSHLRPLYMQSSTHRNPERVYTAGNSSTIHHNDMFTVALSHFTLPPVYQPHMRSPFPSQTSYKHASSMCQVPLRK